MGLFHACHDCSNHAALHNAMLFFAISIALILIWLKARSYALKAQDRAIRAEENLRHFIATGKALDSRLRMGQIYDMKQRRAEAVAAYKKAIAYAPQAEAAQESRKYLSAPYRRM